MRFRGPRDPAAHLTAAALALLLVAPAARGATGHRLDLGLGLTTAYDSNLLQYSDAQLKRFEGGAYPDRFSLESRDDLAWSPELSLAWDLDSGRGRRHLVRLRATGEFHQKNSTADFRAASLAWRESFRNGRRLTLAAYALPSFYLRQLFDPDIVPAYSGLSRYRRAAFALDIMSATYRQRLRGPLEIEAGYQYERRRYVPGFRERDSGTQQAELAVGVSKARAALEGRALYRDSNAKAEDGDGVAGDDVDASYHGPGGAIAGRIEFARRGQMRLAGDLALEGERRRFDSNRASDTFHRDRTDVRFAVESGLRIRLVRRAQARAFWRYETNDAHLGARASTSSDVGSYRQHRVGLALDATLTLWRSAADAGRSTEE